MKNIILVASLLFANMAMADNFQYSNTYTTYTVNSTLTSDFVGSKASAYDQGYALIADIEFKSGKELSRILKVNSSRLDVNSVSVDDTYVKVMEISRSPGNFEYQALVTVNYHYRTKNSND